MDRATIALILSITALLLTVFKWIYDFFREPPGRTPRRYKRNRSQIRLELLEEQTNCFITRGGYLLFLTSFRIYNDSDQAPASIEAYQFQAKIGRKWRDAALYKAPQAMIFPSLLRNSLPLTLNLEARQDFFEVFALDELIPSTEIKVRLKLQEKNGKMTKRQATLKHRVDERPVFDMLFRILE